jgi:hypothetical protein
MSVAAALLLSLARLARNPEARAGVGPRRRRRRRREKETNARAAAARERELARAKRKEKTEARKSAQREQAADALCAAIERAPAEGWEGGAGRAGR